MPSANCKRSSAVRWRVAELIAPLDPNSDADRKSLADAEQIRNVLAAIEQEAQELLKKTEQWARPATAGLAPVGPPLVSWHFFCPLPSPPPGKPASPVEARQIGFARQFVGGRQ